MESENLQPTQPASSSVFFQVTPLSKFLAMLLFVVLPFVGGWVGYHYAPEKVVEIERAVETKMITEVENNKILSISGDADTPASPREQITGKMINILYQDDSEPYMVGAKFSEKANFMVKPNFALVLEPDKLVLYTLPIDAVREGDLVLIKSLVPVEAGFPVHVGNKYFFFARYNDALNSHSMIMQYDPFIQPNRTDEVYETNYQVRTVFESKDPNRHFYPIADKVSGEQYILVKEGSWGCWVACGGELNKFHVFDIKTGEVKSIGTLIDEENFKWVSPSSYRYKGLENLTPSARGTYESCQASDSIITCAVAIDWDSIPWQDGSI